MAFFQEGEGGEGGGDGGTVPLLPSHSTYPPTSVCARVLGVTPFAFIGSGLTGFC